MLRSPGGPEPLVHVLISLRERTIESDDLEVLQSALTSADLPTLRSIRLDIGELDKGMRVSARVEPEVGAALDVSGADRTTVEGVYSVLRPVLARGKQWRFPFSYSVLPLLIAFVVMGGLAISDVLAPDLPAGQIRPTSRFALALLIPLFASAFLLPPAMAWLMPQVEFLAAGDRPRVTRLRGRIFAAVATVVLGVIAFLVTKPLS
jgi:hypothetical protein